MLASHQIQHRRLTNILAQLSPQQFMQGVSSSPTSKSDGAFTGNIPESYEKGLVPILFQDFASDIASRVAAAKPKRVLEIACGTGVVTRQLAKMLPPEVPIVATDLNEDMVQHAKKVLQASREPSIDRITWRAVDAMSLPYADKDFDVVVCQFGVMFFPDKAVAFKEIRRVLKPGGRFIFNVWDKIDNNDFAREANAALTEAFPSNPPSFLARVPYAYFDATVINKDLTAGGFKEVPQVDTMVYRSRAESAAAFANATVLGSPLRTEVESRGPDALKKALAAVAQRVAARCTVVNRTEGRLQAHVYTVRR